MKGFFKLITAIFLGYFIYFLLYGTPDLKRPASIDIPKGASVSQIADKLKNASIIRSELGFKSLVWFKGVGSKLQAGEYTFDDVKSLSDIVRVLTQGLGALNEKQFTVIEGWGINDIAAYFEEKKIVDKNEFLSSVKNSYDLAFLSDKPADVGVEGYLFPDTYRVFKDAKANDIVLKMLENFDSKLTQKMKNDIANQGKTIFDVIRVASIIEKEVLKDDDRRIVSGILWKRLDSGMALQVDSALNYYTGGSNPALTPEELGIDSLYNTYKYRGLPPTPIGNPGLSAIEASIYPIHAAYWYFLSGKDGNTHFGKTLDEHNANKAKYL